MKARTAASQHRVRLTLMALGGALVVCVAVGQLLLRPLLRRSHEGRVQQQSLNAKLQTARQTLQDEENLRSNLQDLIAEMERVSRQMVPSKEDPLSWATARLYRHAREIDLDIASVRELGTPSDWKSRGPIGILFRPYEVEISLACGYDNLLAFIRSLEEENPYLSVRRLTISAQPQSPERHSVQMVVLFPAWETSPRKPAAAPQTPSDEEALL